METLNVSIDTKDIEKDLSRLLTGLTEIKNALSKLRNTVSDSLSAWKDFESGISTVVNDCVKSLTNVLENNTNEIINGFQSTIGALDELKGLLETQHAEDAQSSMMLETRDTIRTIGIELWKGWIGKENGENNGTGGATPASGGGTVIYQEGPKIGGLLTSSSGDSSEVSNLVANMFGTVGDGMAEVFSKLTAQFDACAAAQWVQNAATTAWEAICTAATAVTTAFGAAVSALTSPIGVSLAAIAAITAAGVLLYKNWDTVKEALISAWEAVKAALSSAGEWLITTVAEPVVGAAAELWETVTTIAGQIWEGIISVFQNAPQWFQESVIEPVMDFFTSLWETVSKRAADAWESVKALFAAVSEWFHTAVIQPVASFFTSLWDGITRQAAAAWETVRSAFSAAAEWFSTQVIQPLSAFFTGLWDGFLSKAKAAWAGVQTVFGALAGFFQSTFEAAWAGVVKVFSVAGELFVDIRDGIVSAFRAIVNSLIAGLNQIVSVPFQSINAALSRIRNVQILGMSPFSGIRSVSVPRIPYLAQGAVLPANKPFLAVVGDQRSGTNVEAPLATIEAAVTKALSSQLMAGFAAVVQAIREQDSSVVIGDDVIYRAAQRYESKLAVIQGGV